MLIQVRLRKIFTGTMGSDVICLPQEDVGNKVGRIKRMILEVARGSWAERVERAHAM